nr:penicillin acylase family protein [Desulfobacula sp.]
MKTRCPGIITRHLGTDGFINFKSVGDMNSNGKIWRDSNGVCHIEAENKSDAYRLMGVAHGRDRGMQMMMMRILGQGRPSEILDSSDELLAVGRREHARHPRSAGGTEQERFLGSDLYIHGRDRFLDRKMQQRKIPARDRPVGPL